jgi:predicted DNA-binding transcriptional regulator AlpA
MSTDTKTEKILVPAAEAAKMLSIGKSTLWRGAKDGTLPQPIKIGGATRWRVADLLRAVASGANHPTTA